MAVLLDVSAVEGSTYIVTLTFTDEDGQAEVPATVLWDLTDSKGNVVNSRQDQSETPASTVEVALSGDDLVADPAGGGYLLFTVNATYNSAAFGAGLPLRGQCRIEVEAVE